MTANSDLLCPRCNVPLEEVRTSHGVFWACEKCAGRALTVELLRRTFTPESINPLWLHAISGEGKSGRLCPSCRNPMLEVALSGSAQVAVDVCQHCHFVWFDAHEMDTLAPRQSPASAVELPQKAREFIAIERVKQIAEETRGTDFDSAPPDEAWKQIAGFFGLPVEFEAPEEERKPWATWLLSAAIICVSLLAFPHLRDVVQRFGLIPAQATRLDGLTFVTSFFLHAGIIHLVGNMYFLLVFGDNVEDFLRPLRYLTLIALAHCLGTSRTSLSTRSRKSRALARVAASPAWSVFVFWIFFQLIGALEQKAGMSSVSSFAHLGGAAVGVVAWLIWRKEKPNDQARMSNVEGNDGIRMTK